MKQSGRTHWLRNTLLTLVGCGIAGLLLAILLFHAENNQTYAAATLQFSFNGAGQGTAPNGTPFDASDISSEEVVSAALEATGLGDRYGTEEILENLRVTAVYPENIVNEMTRYTSLLDADAKERAVIADYFATSYDVVLYRFDPAITAQELTGLLQGILESYRSHFRKTFGVSVRVVDPLDGIPGKDYIHRLNLMEKSASQQRGYAEEMTAIAAGFRWNGQSFDDITIRLQSLNEEIERMKASVTQNVLSLNPERLRAQYEMELRNLTWQKEACETELSRLERLVNAYQKDEIMYVSTTGSLQQIENNSSNTYDQLVAEREKVVEELAETGAEMLRVQALLEDVKAAAPEKTGDADAETAEADLSGEVSETEKESLEERIQGLKARSEAIVSDFAALLEVYTDQEINERTVSIRQLKFKSPTLVSGHFIVLAVKTAGPICALGLMVCLFLLIRARRREQATQA